MRYFNFSNREIPENLLSGFERTTNKAADLLLAVAKESTDLKEYLLRVDSILKENRPGRFVLSVKKSFLDDESALVNLLRGYSDFGYGIDYECYPDIGRAFVVGFRTDLLKQGVIYEENRYDEEEDNDSIHKNQLFFVPVSSARWGRYQEIKNRHKKRREARRDAGAGALSEGEGKEKLVGLTGEELKVKTEDRIIKEVLNAIN